MLNLHMQEQLELQKAIDLSKNPRDADGNYILDQFIDDVDYCDAEREVWIWSIGRNHKTMQILASTDCRFYVNDEYKCLFLR
jgi:hypothetical protein